jgi:probable rRNA maturation factor
VKWVDAGPIAVPRAESLARLCGRVLQQEVPKASQLGSVNLVFCEDAHIRDLNKRFRKLDKVTDVLSFNYAEPDVFGEIYIATLKAKTQAPRWKNTFYQELRRLVVHGSLHLAGFDHLRVPERKVMRDREDAYLK